MKTITLFMGIALMLAMPSCTTEKRLYMSGHHIEWLNGKHLPDKQIAGNDIKKVEEKKTVTEAQSTIATNPDDNLTASIDNNPTIFSSQKSVSFHKTVAPVKENTATYKDSTTTSEESTTTVEENTITQIETIVKETKKSKAEKVSTRLKGKDKSWIGALLLCIFLGGLGIHRFYLGYTWQGVVQLLTAGGCGIWALIDLIRIITKNLKPKSGRYKD